LPLPCFQGQTLNAEKITADYFSESLKWDSVYAYNDEVLGEGGTLGRVSEKEAVLTDSE
jgi:type I restriction enzyme R subunit